MLWCGLTQKQKEKLVTIEAPWPQEALIIMEGTTSHPILASLATEGRARAVPLPPCPISGWQFVLREKT